MSTRDELIHLLATRGMLETSQLASALHISKPAAQYHLKLLLYDGLIEHVVAERFESRGRGRPRKTYRLKAQSVPQLSPVLNLLLVNAIQTLTPATLTALTEALYPPSSRLQQAPFIERMRHLIASMAEHLPKWEIHQQGPVLTLQRCPYGQYRNCSRTLCELDILTISRLSAMRVEVLRTQCSPGAADCRFRLREVER